MSKNEQIKQLEESIERAIEKLNTLQNQKAVKGFRPLDSIGELPFGAGPATFHPFLSKFPDSQRGLDTSKDILVPTSLDSVTAFNQAFGRLSKVVSSLNALLEDISNDSNLTGVSDTQIPCLGDLLSLGPDILEGLASTMSLQIRYIRSFLGLKPKNEVGGYCD